VESEGQGRGKELVVRSRSPLSYGGRAIESKYQGLWFTLSRMPWRSLALVPVDEDGSTAGIATALTDVARRLRQIPVTFLLMTGSIDYASAGKFVTSVATREDASAERGRAEPRVIVSVPPVIVEPLALAVTGAADAVLLYVRRGHSQLAATSRTLDLIGRDRVVGSVVG
jgi:hypothetical protein